MSALPSLRDIDATHRRAALRVVRRILRDDDEAEDVVQDVFVRLATRGVPFDGRAAFGTWLHRVLVNSSLNALRARRRRATLQSPLWAPGDPEEVVARRQAEAGLERALARLSEQHRQVVTRRDLGGQDYAEIARALGIPEGTVKSALHRARVRLLGLMGTAAAS
jgi:RNA polymerase sigma-70 factor (ECF subfamily)